MAINDIWDADGRLVKTIMGEGFVHRVGENLPVWEIHGSGPEFEERRIDLLEKVIRDFPRAILKFGHDDDVLEESGVFTERIAPSLWVIPGSIDAEVLHKILWQKNWGIFPIDRGLEPVVARSDEHEKRLIWMRVNNVPLILENDHWLDKWIFIVNPDYEESEGDEPLGAFDITMEYPYLGKYLRKLKLDSGKPDVDIREQAKWLAQNLSSDERRKFIEDGGKVAGQAIFPVEEIGNAVGIKFESDDSARKWLRSVVNAFKWVDKVKEEEREFSMIVQNVIQEMYSELYEKKMVADFTGVVVNSREPYESSARIEIRIDERFKEPDPLESHIYTSFVPLYLKGTSVGKNLVRVVAEKELAGVISVGPYYKRGDGIYTPHVSLAKNLNFILYVVPLVIVIIFILLAIWNHGCI